MKWIHRARGFLCLSPLPQLLVQRDCSACFPWTAKFFLIQIGFCFAAAAAAAVYVLFHMSLIFAAQYLVDKVS